MVADTRRLDDGHAPCPETTLRVRPGRAVGLSSEAAPHTARPPRSRWRSLASRGFSNSPAPSPVGDDELPAAVPMSPSRRRLATWWLFSAPPRWRGFFLPRPGATGRVSGPRGSRCDPRAGHPAWVAPAAARPACVRALARSCRSPGEGGVLVTHKRRIYFSVAPDHASAAPGLTCRASGSGHSDRLWRCDTRCCQTLND